MHDKLNIDNTIQSSLDKGLNNKQLIERSDSEDIVYFLQAYARKDQKFNLALKAHFISVCEVDEVKGVLNTIVNATVKPKYSNTDSMTKSQYNTFVQIAASLLVQLEDKIATEQFIIAYEICHTILKKIHYVDAVYFSSDKLDDLSVDYHHSLLHILNNRVAPELRFTIYKFISSLATKSYYNFPSKYNFVDLLFDDKYAEATINKDLSKIILEKLVIENNYKNSNKINNTIAYLRLIAHSELSISKDYFVDYGDDEIYEIASELYENGLYPVIEYHYASMVKCCQSNQNLNDIYIKTLMNTQEKLDVRSLLIDSFVKYKDFKYFDNLKEISSGAQWKKSTKQLRKIIFNEGDIKNIALYLKKEDLIEELITILKRFGDWSLVRDLSHYLFERNPFQLESVYKNIAIKMIGVQEDGYLSNLSKIYTFIHENHGEQMKVSVKKHVDDFLQKSIVSNQSNQS